GGGLDDLHAVRALEREADVGGQRQVRRHAFLRTHWMWPIITSRASGSRSQRRRSGPGSTRRKKPVVWRSSRSSTSPEPRSHDNSRATVTRCSRSSSFSRPASASATKVL